MILLLSMIVLINAEDIKTLHKSRQVVYQNGQFNINCPELMDDPNLKVQSIWISRCTEASTFIKITKSNNENINDEVKYPSQKYMGNKIKEERIDTRLTSSNVFVTIKDAYLSDIGGYCCINKLTNEQIKTDVMVFKEGTGPTIHINGNEIINEDIYFIEQGTKEITIKCTVNGEFPSPEIYLAKDEQIISQTKQRYGSSDFVIAKIEILEDSMNDSYIECRTINALEKTKQRTLTITIDDNNQVYELDDDKSEDTDYTQYTTPTDEDNQNSNQKGSKTQEKSTKQNKLTNEDNAIDKAKHTTTKVLNYHQYKPGTKNIKNQSKQQTSKPVIDNKTTHKKLLKDENENSKSNEQNIHLSTELSNNLHDDESKGANENNHYSLIDTAENTAIELSEDYSEEGKLAVSKSFDTTEKSQNLETHTYMQFNPKFSVTKSDDVSVELLPKMTGTQLTIMIFMIMTIGILSLAIVGIIIHIALEDQSQTGTEMIPMTSL